MDAENRALCYFYRHPPPQSGVQPLSYRDICPLVYLTEKDAFGEPKHPSVAAVFKCVKQWARERKKRGRQAGWRKTTKAEDKQIHTCFQEVRKPLGKKGLCEACEGRLASRLESEDFRPHCQAPLGREGGQA